MQLKLVLKDPTKSFLLFLGKLVTEKKLTSTNFCNSIVCNIAICQLIICNGITESVIKFTVSSLQKLLYVTWCKHETKILDTSTGSSKSEYGWCCTSDLVRITNFNDHSRGFKLQITCINQQLPGPLSHAYKFFMHPCMHTYLLCGM